MRFFTLVRFFLSQCFPLAPSTSEPPSNIALPSFAELRSQIAPLYPSNFIPADGLSTQIPQKTSFFNMHPIARILQICFREL